MNEYIVAVKRDFRPIVSERWADRIGSLDGVLDVAGNHRFVHVTADRDVLELLRQALGDHFRVEVASIYKAL